MSDPFNCPKCGAHDYGLFAAAMQGCPHCLRRELAEARSLLTKCRGEIAYQDGLLSQLCPVEGPMAKSPHPALADIDAFLAGDQSPKCPLCFGNKYVTGPNGIPVWCNCVTRTGETDTAAPT